MKNRTDFNRMISACKRGRINLILTKSISRFARNTVDCLETVRKLKSMDIGVVFEKENIDTMKETGEFLITLFSSFAQAGSESLSKNVSWGIRKSMEAGNVPMHYSTLIGYRKGPDGEPEIVPEEAEIVKMIFRWYIHGYSTDRITKELEAQHIPNAKGTSKWHKSRVISILTNVKYMGDAVLQKTYTVDCISKTVRKNNGELPMIYVENHHEPIISREVFNWVQAEMKRRASKRKVQQRAKTEQGKFSGKYALTERLVCGECGTPYRRCVWNIRGKRKTVWRCISRLEFGKKYCHESPTMDESLLHEAILRTINGYISEQLIRQKSVEYVHMVSTQNADAGKTVAQLWQELNQTKTEESQLLESLLDDMENPDLIERMQVLMNQKTELLQQIEQIEADAGQRTSDMLRMQEIGSWCAEHSAGLQAYDDTVTRRFVEKITVVSKERIQIKFYGDESAVDVDL